MTKKGEPMMFIQLEDRTGSIEAIVFPKTLDKVRQLIELERIVQLKGHLSDKDGELKLLVEDISELPNDLVYDDKVAEMSLRSQLVITLPTQVSQDALQQLKAIVERYPGTTDVALEVGSGDGLKIIKAKSQVAFNDALVVELKSVREVQRVRVVEKQATVNTTA
jgi:DNA polymerase-3 subunit alpha